MRRSNVNLLAGRAITRLFFPLTGEELDYKVRPRRRAGARLSTGSQKRAGSRGRPARSIRRHVPAGGDHAGGAYARRNVFQSVSGSRGSDEWAGHQYIGYRPRCRRCTRSLEAHMTNSPSRDTESTGRQLRRRVKGDAAVAVPPHPGCERGAQPVFESGHDF